MANIAWPDTLPQGPESYNYRRVQRENRIASPVDGGPPRLRSLYTQLLYDVSLTMFCSKRQILAFENFYYATLHRGTARFNWKDFLDNSAAEYQFGDSDPYSYSLKGPNSFLLSLSLVMFK